MSEHFDFSEISELGGRLPLIVYELNEVPWRIVDWYISHRPHSQLAQILPRSLSYTTVTHDQGELHPWSTWPTVHRGVYNDKHHIRFINQDLSTASEFPPIWEILAEKGYRVGVFGSLQSYPAPSDKKYSFYIPDTFAQSPETYPSKYSIFQEINLRQTALDGAVAKDVSLKGTLVTDAMKLSFIGVRPPTFIKLATQLVKERTNNDYRARRPLMQAPVAFDVFLNAYKKTRPEFSTFFTNHVAGAMHRYWRYVFPEDFEQENKSDSDRFKSETVLAAMDIADDQIGKLASLTQRDGGSLLILSSMGQEAVSRMPYHGELRLNDPQKLATVIGFKSEFKSNLAMQPDFNFGFTSIEHAQDFTARANRLCDSDGKSIWFRARHEGLSANLGLGQPQSVMDTELIFLQKEDGSRQEIPLADLGISKIFRDPGTGYHQPKGIMIWHGVKPTVESMSRKVIESILIKDMMLYAVSRR
ncbi:hypothetical protein PQQ96_15630 [Paraburkholderia sediminicola]|uniref:hypothetical protein n=1 Tax=Paraburkholderia sediminicola TaxID=458836 RepID=UPI0038BE15B2